MDNLESVITDAVNDATVDDGLVVDTPEPTVEPVETSPVEEPVTHEEPTTEPTTPEEPATPEQPKDEFATLANIPQMGVNGRENRIPYSRVKKITEKAVGDVAEAVLGRKLAAGEKAIDVVKAHVAQIPELTTKVADYESRLQQVGQFEDLIANNPQEFLSRLSRLPAYKTFFDYIAQAEQVLAGKQPASADATTQSQPAAVPDNMPEPDETLPDGTKVYTMDGLKNLFAWQAAKAEERFTKRLEAERKAIEERYNPIAHDWQVQKQREALRPVIARKLEEAKTWPLFDELQGDIINILRQNPNISLEAAYQQAAFPRLIADRNKTKQQIMEELAKAPTSTSVPTRTATKPTPAPTGPRKLEDIIKDEVEKLRV